MARQSAFGRHSNAAASAISPSLTSVAHKWDDHTFYAPPKVPSTSDTATKYHFFLSCEKNVKGASAKNNSKLNFFTSLFNVGPTVKLEVCHLTADLLDPVSLNPNFAKTSTFNFTDGLVLSAFGKQQQD